MRIGAPAARIVAVVTLGLVLGCALPFYDYDPPPSGGAGPGGSDAGGAPSGGASMGGGGGVGGTSAGGAGATGGSVDYTTLVAEHGAQSHWRLGEDTGPVASDARGNAPGTYLGMLSFGEDGALAGDSDTAVGFPGADDNFVTVGDVYDFVGDKPFSLEVWIKPTNLPQTQRGILSKANPGSARGYSLTLLNDTIEFTRYAADASSQTIVADGVQLGEFQHVVAAFGGATPTMRLYLNGELKGQALSTKLIQDTAKFFVIGAREDNGDNAVEAVLDEVAVYDVTLSEEQVRRHHQVGAPDG